MRRLRVYNRLRSLKVAERVFDQHRPVELQRFRSNKKRFVYVLALNLLLEFEVVCLRHVKRLEGVFADVRAGTEQRF